MFSKTFEKMKEDNLSLWEKTDGNYFDKAFALFRVYCGYDSYYLLPDGSSLGKEEETLQINSNDSKTAIKSAFRKNLQKKSINRMFLNRFMEHVS